MGKISIYLFFKIQIKFPRFFKKNYANYTLNSVFVIVTQWLGQYKKKSLVESSIFNNFNKYEFIYIYRQFFWQDLLKTILC